MRPNPWDVISEKYPVGTTIEGKIKNITDFGLFIGIDEGIDGLVHISDISWTKRIKHPSEIYKKGDVIQAIVLDIEKDQERFSLGIKQLQPDPCKPFPNDMMWAEKLQGPLPILRISVYLWSWKKESKASFMFLRSARGRVKSPMENYKVGGYDISRCDEH